MTLLGFKERFVPKIESREKRHTIRAIGKSGVCRFKVGDQVQLYRMVRQKGMRKIVDADPVVTRVESVIITDLYVIIDGRPVTMPKIKELAKADGFDDVLGFFDFFVSRDAPKFTGHIIHWDWRL